MDPIAEASRVYREGLSIKEAAERLGCHTSMIRRAIQQKKLRAFLPPGVDPLHPGSVGYRIDTQDLVAWWTGKAQP